MKSNGYFGVLAPGSVLLAAVMALVASAHIASAATFFGPTAYRSAADVPTGFHMGPVVLEDFEDGALDSSISTSTGEPRGNPLDSDSVDADDGAIDGSGLLGTSFFSVNGPAGILFSLSEAVTSFGLVWTDGAGDITFRAFDALGAMVLDQTYSGLPDDVFTGTTADDYFFGAQDMDGIGSIFISNSSGGIEVDHVQFSTMAEVSEVPLPAGMPLLIAGIGVFAIVRNRQKAAR